MAHQHLAMWKHMKEQKALLLVSYNRLVVESTLDIERQRDMFMKEMDDRFARLNHNYERKLAEITARATSLQTTCEYITHQCQ